MKTIRQTICLLRNEHLNHDSEVCRFAQKSSMPSSSTPRHKCSAPSNPLQTGLGLQEISIAFVLPLILIRHSVTVTLLLCLCAQCRDGPFRADERSLAQIASVRKERGRHNQEFHIQRQLQVQLDLGSQQWHQGSVLSIVQLHFSLVELGKPKKVKLSSGSGMIS